MDSSPNLNLPYLMAAQAQKHVTHNEAIRDLDALVHLSVLDRDLTAPPVDPSNGDRYLVADGATGDWLGKDGEIAAFQDGVWSFHTPREGWICWIADQAVLKFFDGVNWGNASGVMELGFDTLGVNATADTTNRLAVSSDAVLFNHSGNGMQTKLNKNTAGDTASLLMQTNFSGRAEFGLAGDDDFHFKVSPNGSNWNEGLIVHGASGIVTKPSQPYFMGVPITDYSTGGAPTGPIPTTVITDNGGHWNASTHRFTCPVTGHYLVNWSGLQLPAGICSLYKNGVKLRNGNHYAGGAASYVRMSTTTIEAANAGDYFEFYWWNGGGYFNGFFEMSIVLLG